MDSEGGYDSYAFVAEFYDYVVPYGNRSDVSFLSDLARRQGGAVLELGCGTGRVLIPTAREGLEIVGLDLSAMMLDICRKKLATETEDVRSRVLLVQGDMRSFDLGRTFSLITTPFRPFQHLTTVEDQMACLGSVHRHLDDDGVFVLDLFNPSLPILLQEDFSKEWGDEPEFTMPDGRRVVRKHRFTKRDLHNQVSDCELIYYVKHPDGRKERLVHDFQMRYLFRYEAEHLLARCGFEIEEVYADYDKSPFGSVDPGELIFVARKM
jgi:SAM-dependent methyltransferase